MNKLSILLVLSVLLYIESINSQSHFCGSKITSVLSLLCNGNYNTPKMKKATNYYAEQKLQSLYQNYLQQLIEDLLAQKEERMRPQQQIQTVFPFKTKADVYSNRVQNRYKRGVVEECCEKACTFTELSMYCG